MPGNDQPPYPPPPENDPYGSVPPPGGAGGPDRLGEPFGRPKKGKGLAIGVAAAAVLLLVGGGVGTYFLVSNSDGDKSDEPETVSVEEHCAGMDKAYKLVGDDPSGDPQEFADAIEAAGITEDMTEDQVAGREVVIRVIGEASSYDELQSVDEGFTKEETRQTNAYFEYYSDHCTTTEAPSEGSSSNPTP
jgi:hypothetical protein